MSVSPEFALSVASAHEELCGGLIEFQDDWIYKKCTTGNEFQRNDFDEFLRTYYHPLEKFEPMYMVTLALLDDLCLHAGDPATWFEYDDIARRLFKNNKLVEEVANALERMESPHHPRTLECGKYVSYNVHEFNKIVGFDS